MATINNNLFQSPIGVVDFAILHQPRKWDEVKKRSNYCEADDERGEYSVKLIIGDEEGRNFKARVDGFLNGKANTLIEEKFNKLKPKQKEKYKDALAWNAETHSVNVMYPYEQLEDEDGEMLEGWKFTFKRKCLIKYKDKETGEQKRFIFKPLFADKQGEKLDAQFFDTEGKIGNESKMRIKFKPYVWELGDKIGCKLDIYHCQLTEFIPYTGQTEDKKLFDAVVD